MLFGSCVGAGPTIGTGKVRVGGGSVGSSFSVPNSSNSSSCCVYGWAPNNGLGLPLVGILKDVCRLGGSTLSVVGVVRVPKTPLGRAMAPWLTGGMASMASSAALGSAAGLVYAEGSVGGGGPKSSSGTAFTVAMLRSIAQGRLDLRSKAMEWPGGVARFIFDPRLMPVVAIPRTTAVACTRRVCN
ncbi:hypothetical protein D3C76_465300 [compost metagenome]